MFILKSKFKLLVVLIIFSVFCVCEASAATSTDYFERSFIGSYSYVDSNGKWGNFEIIKRNSDGSIAYCIEPGTSFSLGVYNGLYGVSIDELANHVSLTEEKLNLVSLIAYYGWGYNGQVGDEWIVATQALIWKELGRNFQFTSQINSSDPWKYVIEVPNEIQSKMDSISLAVTQYLKKLEFNSNFRFPAYSSNVLNALDNSLIGYKVNDCQNCSAYIRNNQLEIYPFEGNGVVRLKKEKKDYVSNFIVYESSVGQNLIVPGNVFPIYVDLPIEVVTGTVKVTKYDSQTKSCSSNGGVLAGTAYELYYNGSYLYDLIIDKNCNASASMLPLGEYKLKERKAGLNYEIDPSVYTFNLTLDEPVKELVLYDNLIMGQVEITKVDSKTNSCKSSSLSASLEGAIYGIYSIDGTLIQKVIINEACKGLSLKNLIIGDYYIQEIEAPIGYRLDEKKYSFSVTKDNTDRAIPIQVKDSVYETLFKLEKKYLHFGVTYPEDNAVFEIYTNNKKIETLTTNSLGEASIVLPYGDYVIKQVKGKMGYNFGEDILLSVNESTKDIVSYTIENQPIRGTLQILKMDAATDFPLQDAIFDICSEDGYCFQGSTDENGSLIISDLEYGNYYIKEIKAPKGYALNNSKYTFSIQNEGEVIPITIINEQEVIVPNTGIPSKNPFVLILIICLMRLGYFFYEKRKI